MTLAAAAVVAAAAAAAAPPRASFTVDCKASDPRAPITAFNTGGQNLTVATLTLTGLAHLADPIGFRRFARQRLLRRIAARVLTLVPCRDRSTAFAGDVIVPKPGCYTFAVRVGGDVFRRTVPLGVARHCAS
jgi:hypothetical protein